VRPHLHAQNLRHLRITLLFTYSGITNSRIEPIAKSRITVTSLHTAGPAPRIPAVVHPTAISLHDMSTPQGRHIRSRSLPAVSASAVSLLTCPCVGRAATVRDERARLSAIGGCYSRLAASTSHVLTMAISSAVKPRSMSSSARTAGFAACLQPPSALVGDERRHGRALEGAIVRRSQVLGLPAEGDPRIRCT